jgi:hypothetical protein
VHSLASLKGIQQIVRGVWRTERRGAKACKLYLGMGGSLAPGSDMKISVSNKIEVLQYKFVIVINEARPKFGFTKHTSTAHLLRHENFEISKYYSHINIWKNC